MYIRILISLTYKQIQSFLHDGEGSNIAIGKTLPCVSRLSENIFTVIFWVFM
jgi:hypothetical protein